MCDLNIGKLKLLLKNMNGEQKMSISMQNTMLSSVTSINSFFDACETKANLSLCPKPTLDVINEHEHCSNDEQSLNSSNIIIDTNVSPTMDDLSLHQKQLLQHLPSITDITHNEPTIIEEIKTDDIKIDVRVDIETPSSTSTSAISSSSNSESDGSISEDSTSNEIVFKNRMNSEKEYHRSSHSFMKGYHGHTHNPRNKRHFKRHHRPRYRYYGSTRDSPSRSRSRNKYHHHKNYQQARLPMSSFHSQHTYQPQISHYPQFTSPPPIKYTQQPLSHSLTAIPVVYQYTHEHPQSGGQYFHTTTNNMYFQNPNLSPRPMPPQMRVSHHSPPLQNDIPYHHRFRSSMQRRITCPTKMFMRNVPYSVGEEVLAKEVLDMGVEVQSVRTFYNLLMHTGDRIKFATFEFYNVENAVRIKQQFGGGENIEYRFTKLLKNPVIGFISVQDFIENHKEFLQSLHH